MHVKIVAGSSEKLQMNTKKDHYILFIIRLICDKSGCIYELHGKQPKQSAALPNSQRDERVRCARAEPSGKSISSLEECFGDARFSFSGILFCVIDF